MDLIKRVADYKKDHCWQYDIRINNYEEDLKLCGLSKEYCDNLKVSDFDFKITENSKEKKEMIAFIQRHEWLGNISQFTTHWFGAYHKGILAGVILMNVPNSFSKLLGEDTPNLERLISRGACISWSPKNLASSFLMWCIKWMVKNTTFRLFVAYSDPAAKEIGTIYQACNFYYLGQSSQNSKKYINPYTGKVVSDRFFRQKTAYRKFCKEIGVEWQKEWMHKTGMNWHLIPDDIEKKLRDYSKIKQQGCQSIEFPGKHKYAYVLGSDNRETKSLRKLFEEKNKTFPYIKRI